MVIIGLKDIFAAHTFACFILKLANMKRLELSHCPATRTHDSGKFV